MINDIQVLINRELNSFKNEVGELPDDETLWLTVPGITNSVGNLVLHVCGNLKHFIGKNLGDTDYVRNREYELSCKSGSCTDLINELNETIEIVNQVLPSLTEEEVNSYYPVQVGGVELVTSRFLFHLSVHLGFHLGQAGYLRRALTQKNISTNPVSLKFIGQ